MNAPAPQHQSVRVEARGLCKHFGQHEVLRGVSFTVERGEIFVLMGPSGSGKSVLLKHIIGLEEADSGELLIEGQSIHAEGLRDRYRMAMAEAEIQRVVAEKLDIVGLKGTEDKIPGELSGGMKKRVALARALVIEPQLILYDEPTSELDPLIAITIGQEILTLRDRTHATSIVVTHDRELAFGIADRIAMIADGEILEIGRPEEVRRSQHPLVRKFLTADFKPKN